jgi:hypothetical protein
MPDNGIGGVFEFSITKIRIYINSLDWLPPFIFLKNLAMQVASPKSDINPRESDKKEIRQDNVYSNTHDTHLYKYEVYPDTTFKITTKNDSVNSRSKILSPDGEEIDTWFTIADDTPYKAEHRRIEHILAYAANNITYSESVSFIDADDRDVLNKVINDLPPLDTRNIRSGLYPFIWQQGSRRPQERITR